MGYLVPHFAMPRKNRRAVEGGNSHQRNGGGRMKGKGRKKKGGKAAGDNAPLTPGEMHSKTRLR